MSFKVAINGYGRIGQSVLRAIYSTPIQDKKKKIQIVAINELADIETLTYLTRYDTTHGRFPYPISFRDDCLFIGDDKIKILNEPEPSRLPWAKMNIDLLFECSGTFNDKKTAAKHFRSGAPKILLSHPASDEVDATVVFGYNHSLLKKKYWLVSNASCTTNCIVPLLNIIDKNLGIINGVTTTIHSAMNDQPIIDCYHQTNLRLTRSALHSIIPVDTGLALGIERLIPHLKNRFQCLHVRVPTINVSVLDISINIKKKTTVTELNKLFLNESRGALRGLLGYTEEPHASIDFNTDPRSTIVDGSQTRVVDGNLIKLLCWFDNEWGYANRMVDVADHWLERA